MEERDSTATLGERLEAGGADAIGLLLHLRPDLASPLPPDLDELVARAVEPGSLRRAVGDLTRAEDQLLQILVCLPPSATDDDLAGALPEGTDLDATVPAFNRLAAAGLAWRHDGHIHVPEALRSAASLSAGLPLAAFDDGLTLDHLKHAVRTLRTTLTEAEVAGELPPWGPARKAGLLDELSGLLAATDAAAAALRGAPPEAAAILRGVLEGPHTTEIGHPLVHYRVAHRRSTQLAHRPDYADSPAYWLFERGLVLPEPGSEADADTTRATVTRELLLSWQGGRPVVELDLVVPPLATATADADEVDTVAADAVGRLLQAVGDLVDAWSEAPPAALKEGGLGIMVLRSVAALVDRDVETAARIVELAHLAGLVAIRPPSADGSSVEVTPGATAWLAAPPARRWSHLVTAWRRAGTWPSRAGRATDGDAIRPALARTAPDPVAVRARAGVLAALADLEPGQATDPLALAARVGWSRPRDWAAIDDAAIAAAWIAEEADLLGLSAFGALSGFGRTLLDGDLPGAEAALDAALPPIADAFTLQADLTAVVIGRLEYDVLTELRLLADVESTGSASTFRFSQASLRRAFDAGRDADAVVAFLEAHADKGIPSALSYLVSDVARRHGHMTVTPGATVITGDDPAVLADAASHRATRSLGLQLLAPTVAVSSRPARQVLDTLRAAGFFPVPGDDPSGAMAVSRAPSAGPRSAQLHHEPFAVTTGIEGGGAGLDEDLARHHAEAILDGTPSAGPRPPGGRR